MPRFNMDYSTKLNVDIFNISNEDKNQLVLKTDKDNKNRVIHLEVSSSIYPSVDGVKASAGGGVGASANITYLHGEEAYDAIMSDDRFVEYLHRHSPEAKNIHDAAMDSNEFKDLKSDKL